MRVCSRLQDAPPIAVQGKPWVQCCPGGVTRCPLYSTFADISSLQSRVTSPYPLSMRWMRRRGDRVIITSGKYAGRTGTIESNVFQRTVDYPDEYHNGHHVVLDTEVLVTVRWQQVESVG